jgi:ubiquitin C-terminal hydrolase
MGGVGGGHYTATVKHCDTGEWLDFNDSLVKSSSEMSTRGPSTYVLFYTLN